MLTAQIYYPEGDRFFEIASAKQWTLKVTDPKHPNATNSGKDCGSGRPQIEIEAADTKRELSLSVDLLTFANQLERAFLDFCALRFPEAMEGMEAADKLEERNAFLITASREYPAVLAELNRIFKRMHDKAEETYLTIGQRVER